MTKIRYKIVYNRKKNLNQKGTALIQIELYQKGKRKYVSTNIYLSPTQWDIKYHRIIKHPNADSLNYFLYEKLIFLERIELLLWRKNEHATINKVLEKANRKHVENIAFFDFYRNAVNKSSIKESTKKNRFSTLKIIIEYDPQLSFDTINLIWLSNFEHYMLFVKQLHKNTIAKHFRHLKIYINIAIKEEVWRYSKYPFSDFKIKTQTTKRLFLSEEELLSLETWNKQWGNTNKYIDAFLFCCYSGLRFSDFNTLQTQNIELINGNKWLLFKTQKNNTEIRLPIYLLFVGKCLEILDKHKDNLNKFFQLPNNSNLNKQLKTISKKANITKSISFHTARHTFATHLLQQGVNITTIQKLLGHSNVRTTQIYSAVTDRTVISDLIKHTHTI